MPTNLFGSWVVKKKWPKARKLPHTQKTPARFILNKGEGERNAKQDFTDRTGRTAGDTRGHSHWGRRDFSPGISPPWLHSPGSRTGFEASCVPLREAWSPPLYPKVGTPPHSLPSEGWRMNKSNAGKKVPVSRMPPSSPEQIRSPFPSLPPSTPSPPPIPGDITGWPPRVSAIPSSFCSPRQAPV